MLLPLIVPLLAPLRLIAQPVPNTLGMHAITYAPDGRGFASGLATYYYSFDELGPTKVPVYHAVREFINAPLSHTPGGWIFQDVDQHRVRILKKAQLIDLISDVKLTARGANTQGTVVGSMASGRVVPIKIVGSQVTPLQVPPGFDAVEARFISEGGDVIVGKASSVSGSSLVVWNAGKVTTVPAPDGSSISPVALSPNGAYAVCVASMEIRGRVVSTPYLWDGKKLSEIKVRPPVGWRPVGTTVHGVGNHGEIIGYSTGTHGLPTATEPFFYFKGQTWFVDTELGLPPFASVQLATGFDQQDRFAITETKNETSTIWLVHLGS